MADDRLDSFVTDAGKKELQDVEASLDRMYERVKEINKTSIRFENATAASDSIKGLKDNTDKLKKSQDEFNASLNEYQKIEAQNTILRAKINALTSESAKTESELNAELSERKRILNDNAKTQNATYQLRKRDADDERQLNRLIAQEEKQLAREAAAAQKTADREKAQADKEYQNLWKGLLNERERSEREVAKQAIADNKALEKGLAELDNAYLRLVSDYNAAAAGAKKLGAALGTDNVLFKEAAASAQAMQQKLYDIDKAVGQHSRNVGNYASGYNGLSNAINQLTREAPAFANSIQTGLMALSNNFPIFFDEIKKIIAANKELIAQGQPVKSVFSQIASSFFSVQTLLSVGVTLLTLYGDKIITAFTGGSKAAKEAEKANKKYLESIESIDEHERSEAQQKIARLNILTSLAADEAQSTRTRTRAIKELQETYPATFGALDKQTILEGKLGEAVNTTTQALLNRASAQAAEKKFAAAGEKVYDLTVAQRKAQEEINAAQNKEAVNADRILKSRGRNDETLALQATQLARNTTIAKNNYSDITTQLSKANDEQKQFLQDSLDFAKKAGDVLFGKDPKEKRTPKERVVDTTSNELAAVKRLADAQAKLRDQQIQQDIEANKQIYNDDTQSLESRLLAYENYQSDRIYQAENEATKEKEILQSQLRAIAELKLKTAKKSPAEEKLITEEKAINTELLAIEEKQQSDIAEINRQGNEFLLKIEKDYHTKILKAVSDQEEQVKIAYTANYAYQKSILDKKLANQEITEARYRRSLANLDKETQAAAINGQITFLQNQEFVLKQLGINTDEIAKEIAKLQNSLNTLKNPAADSNALKGFAVTDEDLGDLTEKIKTAQKALELFKGFTDVAKQLSDQRIAGYDAEIDSIKKRNQIDIDGINASAATDEEKKKKIAQLNAKEAAQEEQINTKKLQAKRKQAAIDKAIAIANIISTTALAVVTTLSDKTIVPGYARIPLAALIGALGAAQLAVAIATPLPQFATGTESSPEGWAVTGEKGRELKITKDGEVSLTKDHANIEYLKKGTIIKPANETADILKYIAIQQLPLIQKQPRYSNDDVVAELKGQTKSIVQAIVKKQFRSDQNFDWSLYKNNKTRGAC